MKHITNYPTLKYIFSVQFLALIITSVLISQSANAVVQQVDLDETIYQDQVNDFRSQDQWCSPFWWAALFLPPYVSPSAVGLSDAANVVAADISNFMAANEISEYSGEVELDLGEYLPSDQEGYFATNSIGFYSNNPTFQGALEEWTSNPQNCNAIMTVGFSSGFFGIGKAIGNSGLPYWTMILFNEGQINDPDFDPPLASGAPGTPGPRIPDGLVTRRAKADLVVTSFKQMGKIKKIHERQYEVDVRVVVKNQGNKTAGTFRIGALAANRSVVEPVPFTVVGQKNSWKPLTGARLYPGETVAVEGKVSLNPRIESRLVKLYVIADACSESDSYCSVNESNGDNNQSKAIYFINPFRVKHTPIKKSFKFNR